LDRSASQGVLTSFGAVSNLYFFDLSVTSLCADANDVWDEAVEGLEGLDRKDRGEFAVDTDMTLSRQEAGSFGRAMYWFECLEFV
jgi:hypothetical protein